MKLTAVRLSALASCLVVLLANETVSAREGGRTPEPASPETVLASQHARLTVTMAVSRAGETATYSVTLKNAGPEEIRDIFLAAGIPAGTTFLGPGPNPARSGFRSVEGDNATWLSEGIAPYSSAGPFTYRVRLSADTAPGVHAWVHWLRPSDASAISGAVRVLPSVTFAPMATGPVDSLPQVPLLWRVLDVAIAAQFEETNPGGPIPRMIYMTEGTRHFGQDGVTASYSAGVAHFIKAGTPFLNANRTDTPAGWLQFTLAPAAQRGAPLAAPPAITLATAYESEDLAGLGRGPYDMIFLKAEFQPGGKTALHHHPGPVMVHVLEGTLAHTTNGVTRTQGPGSFWVEQVGEQVTTKNIGNTVARLVGALLIPRGEDPADFLEPPDPWSFR